MITCDYCGRENGDTAVHCRECGTALVAAGKCTDAPTVPAPAASEPPPALPAPRLIDADALGEAFSFEEGFHRVDWDFVWRWIEAHVSPVDVEEAWNEVVLLWLQRLRDDLGGTYYVLQSRQTVLLCEQPPATGRWLLEYAARTAGIIQAQLGETAWDGAMGKDVALVFSDEDDYYQYLAPHLAEGEQAASGGVCVHTGCVHIALPWRDPFQAANTIAHELTHDCLAHLALPLWLNEGVAVTLERHIAPPQGPPGEGDQQALYAASINWRPPVMFHELAERHLAYWTEENIQSFWAGTSFFEPGDPNELSYSLAEVFVKLLGERGDGAAFRALLEHARQDDAGQNAALNILAADLGEIAGTFLGAGNWRPQRKAMIACWEKAGWRKAADETG